jgi:uncharacterized protein YdhG (YjbR/CyaY superfamily)
MGEHLADRKSPKSLTIDGYIAKSPAAVRPILRKIRRTIKTVAPEAQELISYGIPAFKQRRILVYFAAFNDHIGLYPPVKGDAKLHQAIAPYAGPKGNLKFPLARPIPYGLIKRIVRVRAKQERARAKTRERAGAARS